MANSQTPVANTAGYSDKLSNVIRDEVDKWFKGLTKEELLQFMADRPLLTADVIRSMFKYSNLTIGYSTSFNTAKGNVDIFFDPKE